MTEDQFRARFRWTADPATACWVDLQGDGVYPDTHGYPARATIRRHEGAAPTKHGQGTYTQRANRLAYETFIGPSADPPHATCDNRACFNPEHLKPTNRTALLQTPLVLCYLCGKRVPREQAAGRRHYVCKIHAEERAKAREERRKAKEERDRTRVPREPLRLPETIEELFAAVTWDVSEAGCWVNVKGKGVYPSPYGYYQFARGKQRMGLHRLVFSLSEQRPLEHGEQVCHHCDNPGCINPKHMFAGTRSDNIQDAKAKGRLASGGNGRGGALSEDQVLAILDSTESSYVIGPRYGLTSTQIRRIKNGTRWRDVHARWEAVHASA